ncbi:MAG: MATE family efflux transporter [Lachnospiraceae bacterium]|nr:MATE family efflux transporter [Lachnospiraceae bacterium]
MALSDLTRGGRDPAAQYMKMTETPVSRLILTLAVPTVISMLVTNIYNLVDTAFVGMLGNSASGAVGIVFGYMAILQSFGFMYGQGGGSITSRELGARDQAQASRTASTAFFCALITGTVLAGLSFFIIDPLIHFLGSTDTIAPYAKTYISYILIAAPFTTASFTLNNLLRYEGKAFFGMIGLMVGGILNIAGDPLFMFGLKMGIAGAGLSTCLSQTTSFLILLSVFLRGKTTVHLSIRNFTPTLSLIGLICTTGLPSLLRQSLTSIATIILNWEANPYGDEAVAAMSIVSRVSFFIFAAALGIGQGFQPVSAFNYGAGKYSRVRRAYGFTIAMAEALLAVVLVFVVAFSERVVGIFRNDPTVIEIGTRALRLQCAAIIFLPPTMVTEMLLQSTGQRLSASLLSALRSGIFFIPLLLILSRLRGLYGIEEAQPLAYFLAFFPSVFFAIRMLKDKMPREDAVR